MMALLSMAVLFAAGTSSMGVRLDARQWFVMIGLLLVGLIPFAVMGIMFGHLLKVDSLGPAIGGVTSLFALLGGSYGPLITQWLPLQIVKFLPSYWLVQAGKTALRRRRLAARGVDRHRGMDRWCSSVLAVRVYQRDTKRV